ncbi:MAG TPA: hypothetical protein VL961_06800, partial [Acidimicrobiales bacterium]|nr:hypothetical protein [Acidimicrobiales bacterium]
MKAVKRLRGRSAFAATIGVAAGIIAAGLVVPYVRVQAKDASPTRPNAASTAAQGSSSSSTDSASAEVTTTTLAAGTSAPAASDSGASTASSTVPVSTARTNSAPAQAQPVNRVTSNTINLGIALIDVGEAAQFGYDYDIGNEQARYQSLVNSINNAGGINGRKIVPYFESFNAVDPTASSQAACIAWTQTDHVFAVLVESQFPTAAEVCILDTGTPVITTQGTQQAYYANGLFFTTMPSDDETLGDEADYLASSGSLTGKTVGVLTDTGTDDLAVQDSLVPDLQKLGYSVKDVEAIPDNTSGSQAIPVAISNMQADGVNFVILAANVILSQPFVQSASQAGFNPRYAISDFNNQINQQVASNYPSSFNGTVAFSQTRFAEYEAGAPFAPADKACLNIVQPVDSTVLPTSNAAWPVAMGDC